MARPSGTPGKKKVAFPLLSRIESLPVLLAILCFGILAGAGPELRSSRYVFEPPWLLLVLNTVFITGLGVLITALCFRSFLRGGFLNVLLLGCGVLAFGLTSLISGWMIRPPHGPDEAETVHNLGVLCASLLFFWSALNTSFGIALKIEKRRGTVAMAACAAILALGAILATETALQSMPSFFIAGERPTILRQVVLTLSVTLLLTSALLMMTVYAERRGGFLLYTVNALLLIATGLVGIAVAVPGSPLNWLGRAAQYLGNVYLVVASFNALGEARSRGTTVERELAAFFRESETHYKTLIEMAADPVLAIDREGKIILMNPAAEETLGYRRDEAAGRSVAEIMVSKSSLAEFEGCLSRQSCRDVEMEMAKRDGTTFPAELSVSPETGSGERATRTIIIRDVSQRKRIEEKLREANDLLERRVRERTAELLAAVDYGRSLLEASLDPLVTISREGRITDVNRATEQVTGLARDRLIGTDFSDYFTDPGAARRGYRKAFAESEVRDYPLTIRHAGGKTTDVMYHASVYRNSAGEILGLFAAARDITEVRKAETALREINESLERRVAERTEALQLAKDYAETLIRTANVLIIGLDAAANVMTFNDQAEKVTGYARAEILGRNWFEVVVPRDRFPSAWEAFSRLHEGALPEEYENPILTQDGRERIISWRNSELREGGTVKGTISFGRDITERRRAEEALRAHHELLKIAQLAANAGIWGWDIPSGAITWSEELYSLFGLDPATPATFQTWQGTVHPDDRQPATQRILRSVREGIPLENEFRIIRPDGRLRWIRARGRTVYSGNGEPLSMSDICIDATESKQVEEALREAKEGLEEKVRERTAELVILMEDLERSRDDLRRLASELVIAEERERKRISGVLHDEMAQTLAAAKMRLDLLRSMPGGEDGRKAVSEAEELIGQSIRQTRALMTDITNPVLYDMGLQAAVDALAEDVRARQDISFACTFSGKLGNLGQELDLMIFQVVKELVQNVVKHSRARNADIRIAEEGKFVRVIVADDGSGFDAGDIGLAGAEGGFGLFSIRERVKSYGGTIVIDSEPGKGARVTVVLPKTAGSPRQAGRTNRTARR